MCLEERERLVKATEHRFSRTGFSQREAGGWREGGGRGRERKKRLNIVSVAQDPHRGKGGMDGGMERGRRERGRMDGGGGRGQRRRRERGGGGGGTERGRGRGREIEKKSQSLPVC